MNYVDPLALSIWAAVIGVALVLICVRLSSCMRVLQNYRRELIGRAQTLRLHKMLTRLGISLPRYLRKARPVDVERHLLICQYCQRTDDCDAYLKQGKDIDASTFCANAGQLQTYKQPGK